ncbi:PaaI family thioesterase [Brevibacillus humidisoli]|uniref:PaaI family thioesterase n=1 Tax=Brevibacillus humidisoli TaxID=2895522 RepID=UPI001E386C74|nr:PaaI family thioesterase [Brevibacillus humidisoli]UFJ39353.1 PaaI family thioesterase [Brevibacillus humidisoli]
MLEELREIWENGTEQEREVLALAAQAVRRKRERNSAYLSGFLGLSGEYLDEEKRTYQFIVPITPFMHNSLGVVHGGITATLIDSTMGSLINRSLPNGRYAVTTELKINYIRPGTGKQLRCVAAILHRGQSLVVCEASLYDDVERLVAHATGSFMLLGHPKTKGATG